MSKAVVVDFGTAFTKIGFGGNILPEFIIPTTLSPKDADSVWQNNIRSVGVEDHEDLDSISLLNEWNKPRKIVERGIISDYDLMEKYLQRIFSNDLQCDSHQHFFLFTDPPHNTPRNREFLAELMFEVFGVPGLSICHQALFSICTSWTSKNQTSHTLTGIVIDSGEGCTHVVPVCDGVVMISAARHIPIAGSDITNYIMDSLREREEDIPPDESLTAAISIKEDLCYISSDILREYKKFDNSKETFKKYEFLHPLTKKMHSIDVGYEQFLAPEILFAPTMHTSSFSTPLPQAVDDAIQACGIEFRKQLYGNIVMSGGSTLIPNLGRRVQRDLQEIVDKRLLGVEKESGQKPMPIQCKVVTHGLQKYAVWHGGSRFSVGESFPSLVKSKKEYDEIGSSIFRKCSSFS